MIAMHVHNSQLVYTHAHGQAQQDDGGGTPGEEAPGVGAVPVRTPFQGAISTIFTKHLS